jgi:hypothetical protein
LNKDLARKVIAIAFSGKKGDSGMSLQEITNVVSFKKGLLSPEEVSRFVEAAVGDGLMVHRENQYLPNFSTSGIVVPLDFSVDVETLLNDSTERPLVDRMLEAITASGRMTKKEAIAKARELTSNLKYLDFELSLLAILSENAIENSQFVKEIMERRKIRPRN